MGLINKISNRKRMEEQLKIQEQEELKKQEEQTRLSAEQDKKRQREYDENLLRQLLDSSLEGISCVEKKEDVEFCETGDVISQ